MIPPFEDTLRFNNICFEDFMKLYPMLWKPNKTDWSNCQPIGCLVWYTKKFKGYSILIFFCGLKRYHFTTYARETMSFFPMNLYLQKVSKSQFLLVNPLLNLLKIKLYSLLLPRPSSPTTTSLLLLHASCSSCWSLLKRQCTKGGDMSFFSM